MKSPVPPRILAFTGLAVAVLLASIAFFKCRSAPRLLPNLSRPRFTMAELDTKAQPHITEAQRGVSLAVHRLCSRRCHLFILLLKDKCTGGSRARNYIGAIITPGIVNPLRRAASVYGCAVNADAATGMARESAVENLSQQLYASTGLSLEAAFIRTTIASCTRVLTSCAPKLAVSWGLVAPCAVADGPLPLGDIIGVTMAVGGTMWSCWDLYRAYKALPAALDTALRQSIAATVTQCRQEAASAL